VCVCVCVCGANYDDRYHLVKYYILTGPPKLKSEAYQMRRVIRAGETLRLTCPVESPPPAPLFTWSKDGDPVHVGWDRYRTNADVLRVRDLERSDSGVFICRATNGFGTLDVKYLVYVYGMCTVQSIKVCLHGARYRTTVSRATDTCGR